MRFAYYIANNKKIQIKLTDSTRNGRITSMNTLNTLTNSIIQVINENTIDSLVNLGYDHTSAVKIVTEFDGYDFDLDAQDNPVSDF